MFEVFNSGSSPFTSEVGQRAIAAILGGDTASFQGVMRELSLPDDHFCMLGVLTKLREGMVSVWVNKEGEPIDNQSDLMISAGASTELLKVEYHSYEVVATIKGEIPMLLWRSETLPAGEG